MGSDKFYPFVTEVSCYAKVNVFWIYVSVVSFIWGGGGADVEWYKGSVPSESIFIGY